MIQDPAFYALAALAVLLMGLGKSGFLAGFGAFATPLLALAVPVPQAAAIMLPLLLVMDATGLQQLWRARDRALLRLLLPAGLAGTGVGWALFGLLSTRAVAALVGALTLAFVAQRLLRRPRRAGVAPTGAGPAGGGAPQARDHSPSHPAHAEELAPPRPALARTLALVAGFTSFVAHAGGPPIQAYVLPLRLDPLRAAATMAVFFAAINLSKWIPYAQLGLLDARNLLTSLVLAPLAPLGVWLGVWLLRRVHTRWFYRLAYAGMVLTGSKLLWDGLA